jgi:hypothetical protein
MENVKVLDLVLVLLLSAKKIYVLSASNLVIERTCQPLSPLFSQINLIDMKPNLITSRRVWKQYTFKVKLLLFETIAIQNTSPRYTLRSTHSAHILRYKNIQNNSIYLHRNKNNFYTSFASFTNFLIHHDRLDGWIVTLSLN